MENGRALKYVKEHTPEICMAAAKQVLLDKSWIQKDLWDDLICCSKLRSACLIELKEANNDFREELINNLYHPDRYARMYETWKSIR